MATIASEGASSPTVWLFRTPAGPSSHTDPYQAELASKGYRAVHIPVLKDEFRTQELEEVFRSDKKQWDGVIITSKRGAEGWIRAARAVCAGASEFDTDFSSIPLYTVGQSSIDILSSSSLPLRLLPDLSKSISAQTATLLAPLTIAPDPRHSDKRSYLFVRGDKSTNELQDSLRQAGHAVYEVEVYATSPNPDLGHNIQGEIACLEKRLDQGKEKQKLWLAFFSPSSAGYALPHLDSLLRTARMDDSDLRVKIRIFAIGGTTRAYLADRGLKVDAVADEPSAKGLVQAIQQTD